MLRADRLYDRTALRPSRNRCLEGKRKETQILFSPSGSPSGGGPRYDPPSCRLDCRSASLSRQALNGELEALPEPFRGLAAHLAGLPVEARQGGPGMASWPAATIGTRIILALADVDPTGPPPEADADDDEAADDWGPIRLGTLPPAEPFPLDVLPLPGPRPGRSRRRVDRLPGGFPRRRDPGRRLGDHRPIGQPAASSPVTSRRHRSMWPSWEARQAASPPRLRAALAPVWPIGQELYDAVATRDGRLGSGQARGRGERADLAADRHDRPHDRGPWPDPGEATRGG